MLRIVVLLSCIHCLAATVCAAAEAPFAMTRHGHFQRMLHSGDASGHVVLAAIAPTSGMYGLGALAELRGEIVLWDGHLLVTPGDSPTGATRAAEPEEQAALLVTSTVLHWQELVIEREMTREEFEAFVVEQAQTRGIDTEQPFPFLVRGVLRDYVWHVVTGQAVGHGKGSGHRLGHAQNRVFSGAQAQGKLVGIYSAAQLEGMITHPGERFHLHFATDDLAISGHVDSYGIRQGAILLLPQATH